MRPTMDHWLIFSANGVHWRVAPEWRDRLFDAAGLRLPVWQSAERVEIVKEAPHRTIQRIRFDGGAIYLKHYPTNTLVAWFRQLLRPPKALTECEKALELARRGVSTIEPLAVGQGRHGESYLITRGIDASQPLNTFLEQTLPKLPPSEQHRVRLETARALAELLANMHDAGVLHRDLHPGNVLIQIIDGRPRLHLIDLHMVRLGAPLSWTARRDNLAMLNGWFLMRASRADRLRFWRAYMARAGVRETASRSRETEARTWDYCLRFWRRRDGRCVGNNRYFYRLKEGACHGWAVRDLSVTRFRELLADPDAPLSSSGCRVLKHSRSSTVGELTLTEPDGTTRQVIYKRFSVTRWSDPWFSLARSTPALRSWVNGHRLRDCGLPTARPLAVIQRRRHGLVHECYLLTEKLTDCRELREHVAHLESLPNHERRSRVRALLDRIARLVRRLHERQLSHRDLKAANILVRDRDGLELFLIDLVGAERWRRLPHSRCVKNLARLHASFHTHPLLSRTDRLRFLRTYMNWALHGQRGWKDWWRRIAQATQNKITQNERRGRPLA